MHEYYQQVCKRESQIGNKTLTNLLRNGSTKGARREVTLETQYTDSKIVKLSLFIFFKGCQKQSF